MKTSLTFLLTCLLLRCAGPANQTAQDKLEVPITSFDSLIKADTIPFRFLSYSEKNRLSPKEHRFGDLTLKKAVWPVYEYQDSMEDLLVTEVQPNVLLFKSLSGDYLPLQRIEYYDQQGRLIQKVPIDQYGPYKSLKSKIIDFVFPDREYYADPEDENHDCLFSNLPKPDSFLLIPVIAVSPSGYTTLAYNLAKISTQHGHDHMVVGWEEKLFIYNPQGKVIARLTIPHDARSYFVSSDGKYLIIIYGGTSGDNPLDYCNQHFQIIHLSTLTTIYEQQDSGVTYFVEECDKEDFLVMSYEKEKMPVMIFFDLKSGLIYSRTFSLDESKEVGRNFTSYPDLFNKYIFNTEKI